MFQPKYAAYLNPIGPWWKILRSPTLKGRRCEAQAQIEKTTRRAADERNVHKYPFIQGRRRHLSPILRGTAPAGAETTYVRQRGNTPEREQNST